MRLLIRLESEGFRGEHEVYVTRTENAVALEVDGETHDCTVVRAGDGTLQVQLGDDVVPVRVLDDHTALVAGHRVSFALSDFAPGGAPGEHDTRVQGEGVVRPPMPGKVVRVLVAAGDEVTQGQALLVLEAMKMQSTIAAPRDGRVAAVHVAVGEAVDVRDVLVEIEG